MTEEMKTILTGAGMDVEDALHRFMDSEAMLEKFLKKFRKDSTFEQLKQAVEARDLELAFRGAHTLKGVAANYSFVDLQKASSEQCEEFRAEKLEEGIAMMPAVEEAYARVISALDTIYGKEE